MAKPLPLPPASANGMLRIFKCLDTITDRLILLESSYEALTTTLLKDTSISKETRSRLLRSIQQTREAAEEIREATLFSAKRNNYDA